MFRLLWHLLRVKCQKYLYAKFFFFSGCGVWNPWVKFLLGQRLIPFVRGNYCNCASRRKFHANEFEFFKRACKISKLRPPERIFDARRRTLCGQFPIYVVSMHNYAPKSARVMETRGPFDFYPYNYYLHIIIFLGSTSLKAFSVARLFSTHDNIPLSNRPPAHVFPSFFVLFSPVISPLQYMPIVHPHEVGYLEAGTIAEKSKTLVSSWIHITFHVRCSGRDKLYQPRWHLPVNSVFTGMITFVLCECVWNPCINVSVAFSRYRQCFPTFISYALRAQSLMNAGFTLFTLFLCAYS